MNSDVPFRHACSSQKGLSAKASQDRRGIEGNQLGSAGRRLAAMRKSSKRWQPARVSGSPASRLPESISFCRSMQRPNSPGSVSISLSVRINQRNLAGREAAGTVAMRLALKPTMVSAGQRPSTSGNSVKRFSEQKRMRSFLHSASASGNSLSWLPVRSSTSNVSLRLRISGGNTARFSASLRWRAPQSSPARSCSRVCMGSSLSTFGLAVAHCGALPQTTKEGHYRE